MCKGMGDKIIMEFSYSKRVISANTQYLLHKYTVKRMLYRSQFECNYLKTNKKQMICIVLRNLPMSTPRMHSHLCL